ncbi:ParA family protein [Rummeliibacillus pycnus]|uniref:ParA family protein n=1 Tax=Rummeliibacillus pycnus TaxID=101070 RepID=UPI003D2985AA
MALKITFGNFKGGVGKTTISCIVAYILAERGFKTLHVNFDLQTNATMLLGNTFPYENSLFAKKFPKKNQDDEFEFIGDYIKYEGATTVYQALVQKDLKSAIVPLTENLDIVPSSIDLSELNNLGTKATEKMLLKTLIDEIEDDYDVIIFDPKPSIDLHTTNTIMASDYVIGVLKTEVDSFEGLSYYYLDYIEGLSKEKQELCNEDVKLLGIVAYQFDKSDTIDNLILEISNEDERISKLLFKTIIYYRKRIKGFRSRGISRNDIHDKKAMEMFDDLTDEILERILKDDNK